MVSYYHHHKLIKAHGYKGDLPNFARRFMNNQIMYGDFFKHLDQAWEYKDNQNFLFLFYEDMKRDIRNVIERVSQFLNRPLTNEQVDKLVEHLDIKNFRNNPAVNMELGKSFGLMEETGHFIRKGHVGGWKEEFAEFPELEKSFNAWIELNMEKSRVEFPNE